MRIFYEKEHRRFQNRSRTASPGRKYYPSQTTGFQHVSLFIPGRDEALIQQVPVTSLKRNDVALYRRDQGILVLHRIVRVTANGYYMTGDNQYEIEGPLRPDQFRGKLIAFVRNGKEISVRNPVYRFLSALWLLMLPVRPFCFRLTAFLRRTRSK